MKKLALKLLLVAVLVYAGAGQAVAQPPPEMVGWWQRAITAAHAAIASVKGVAIAPGLDEMPEVNGEASPAGVGHESKGHHR